MAKNPKDNCGRLMDQDYWGSLSPEDAEWLRNFNNGEYRNNHRDNPVFEDLTDEEHREMDSRNNARRRDAYNQEIEDLKDSMLPRENVPDTEIRRMLKSEKTTKEVKQKILDFHVTAVLILLYEHQDEPIDLANALSKQLEASYQDMDEFVRERRKLWRKGKK